MTGVVITSNTFSDNIVRREGATIYWLRMVPNTSGLDEKTEMEPPTLQGDNIYRNNLENGFVDVKKISSEVTGKRVLFAPS